MKSLIIISDKTDYEFSKKIYTSQIDKIFRKKIFEKIYLVFYSNDLIDEYWCKCIPIQNYADGYIRHLNYDKDFIRANIDYLQRFLLDDINSDNSIFLYNSGLSIELLNKLIKVLQKDNERLKIVSKLEELC